MRDQVIGAVAPHRAVPAHARSAGWVFPALATAAALAFGFGYARVRGERDVARREALGAKDGLEALGQELTKAQVEMAQPADATWPASVRYASSWRVPDVRVTRLAGLPPAPKASARVVWDPGTRQAVLFVSGLDAAPAGKGV